MAIMKALVIGGTGPTGPYVVDGLLERGYEVSILHRGVHEINLSPEVEHIHGDPNFEDTLEEALGKRKFDLAVGMYGRLRSVARVLRGHIPRFISVGACRVYQGWGSQTAYDNILIPTPEEAPLVSDPQVDKFTYRIVEAESEVMKAHQEGYYNATHFRYPLVYGPRQLAPREWSILRRILDGRSRLILPAGGLTIWSIGYAENMAHALLLAADEPEKSSGQIYNVRDERLLYLRSWVACICKLMNHQFEFVEMPYSLAPRPDRIYSWGPYHRVMDITKVKEQLGYRDVIPVEKAMELTVKWYLENRPTPGGEVEQQLGDPFDYAMEDRLIDEFKAGCQRVRELTPPQLGFQHAYAHPKHPGETV